ncbi:MAG: RluA family pseudouridine synthase [Oscillospiraceae bacterium]|jgi:23S rRNA pseudouridine1911/1915/1917 synthase|nr:RluA family pseudouridine synthase [Oscillospiraceae bacterium]
MTDIIYEDNHLLVVLKPVNMPTQSDSSGDLDLLTCLKDYIKKRDGKPGGAYLGLVHRLDRPVGGLVAFAKTSKAAARLSAQLVTREMHREYLAVVCGITAQEGRLTDFLVKDERSNTSRVVPAGTKNAKEAILNFRRVGLFEGSAAFSLTEVTLETGRSHQIRVQMANAGFPLWGDARYGHGKPTQQIALCARRLRLIHPTLGKEMEFRAPTPEGTPWKWFEALQNQAKTRKP